MTARYANVGEVPLALAVFLATDNYDYNSDPNTISATTLLKPVRQIILPGRIAPGEVLPNLADMMSNRMGSAIHDAIERSWLTNHIPALQALGLPQHVINRTKVNPTPDALQPDDIPVYLEQRHHKQVGKWQVSGKYDFVMDGQVQDFKTTSVFTYKNQLNGTKWALQGSLYRWLKPEQITQDRMAIHYIFTDWKASMVKTDSNYPPKRFHTQLYELTSVTQTEQFVRRKLAEIDQYMDADEQDIPYCSDEDLWRSEPSFKYYKSGDVNAKRSTKNFPTRQEALIYMGDNGNVGAIKEVPGQVIACKYCPAFAACSQKDQLIANGDLLME